MRAKILLTAVTLAVATSGCSGTETETTRTTANPVELTATTAAPVESTTTTAATSPTPLLPSLDLFDVSDLVKEARKGVVSVTQERVRLDLFGVPEEVPAGAGTGIVIDDEGLILTNFHVIEGASRVLVIGDDGRQREAAVVAQASSRDLALLQLSDVEGLEPLELASLDSIEVGDPVIAIGNALGLDSTDPTVSAGIVSAKGRTIRTSLGTLQDLIQTDAAINPGNSGGPLLNAAGEVVGVNSAIIGGAQNIGFAISVETAAQFIERYRLGVGEPFVGVQMVDNSPAAAERFNLGVDDGALVIEVVPGASADAAGLRQWDVILEIGDVPISATADVVAAIQQKLPGDTLAIVVMRGEERLTLDVVVGERPEGM
jgi:S1-C subfamily serine protease